MAKLMLHDGYPFIYTFPAALDVGLWGTNQGDSGVSEAVPNAVDVIMMYCGGKFEMSW